MKSLTRELWMEVPVRRQIVSIHDQVEALVRESGVQEGFCLGNCEPAPRSLPSCP